MVRLRLRVKEIAQEKSFTMSALQRAADINMKTIQAIYKDPYHETYYSVLYKIAKVLWEKLLANRHPIIFRVACLANGWAVHLGLP